MQAEFTREDLRRAIPERCFRPSVCRSSLYPLYDMAIIAACYWALGLGPHWLIQAALIFVIGTMMWALFVIGHEAGHGAFSRHRTLNTLVGMALHTPLLVPYRAWQRSHALHHMNTGHLQKEEPFRAVRAEQDYAARKALYRSGLFILIGWPMYLLGFRNIEKFHPIKASHFLTVSDLYASHVRASFIASALLVPIFLASYVFLGLQFGWVFFAKYLAAPYLVFAAWLTFVTYIHHVDPDVPVYDAKDWSPMKGALATVDRDYGPFNWLTHHIGDQHVIHHIFPTIPHYRAAEAMRAIEPILGPLRMRSERFVLVDFLRAQIGCHHVVPAGGYEAWRSAYPWARKRQEAQTAAQQAE
ncbi:MAG: fatty acid desaturase [Pseudomonadota bacterium]